jgi:FG-GAP-like repeat
MSVSLSDVTTSVTFTEAGSAVTLSPSLAVSDSDSTTLASATVQITGGTFGGDADTLTFSTGTTSITANYDSTSETLTLTGSDTLANYQQVLDGVAFNSTSQNPTDYGSDPARTVTWTVNDGSADTTAATTINITAVNNPPTLSGVAGSASFTEHGGAVTLSSAVSITDPDDLDLSGATVAITGGSFAGASDTLAVSGASGGTFDAGAITVSYDSTTETLTLSGTDTLAEYQTALDEVTFGSGENPTDYGSNPTRTVTWQVQDPSGTANSGSDTSTLATTTVSITNVNDAPTLALGTRTVAWTEEQSPLATSLSPSVTITDPDDLNLASATVSIASGFVSGDTLAIGSVTSGTLDGGKISYSYSSNARTLTLTGSDTLAEYQNALDAIAYNGGENPTVFGLITTRKLVWTLNDGGGTLNGGVQLSAPVTSTISVTGVNDAPTLALGTTASWTEEGADATLAPSASITDIDNNQLVGGTVQIAGGTFSGDGDLLEVYDPTFGSAQTSGVYIGLHVTYNYDFSTQTLTLSGTDSLSDYRTVLEHVVFTSGENPTNFGSDPSRLITWQVNDGGGTANGGVQLSSVVTMTLGIINVNDPPTLGNVASSAFFTEEHAATTLSPSVSVTDPDNLNLVGATVKITGGTFSGDGDVLAAEGTNSGTIVQGGGTITVAYSSETLTLTGTDTLADYQAVLDAVTFQAVLENPTNFGSNPTRTLVWTLNDGSGSNKLSTPVTSTVTITNVNDAPTLGHLTDNAFFTEEGGAATLSGSATVSDPDDLDLSGATVKIVGGTFASDGDVLAATTTGTVVTASYNSSTETLTLSGIDTLAHYQSVLDSITFNAGENPTNYGSNPTRAISWMIMDPSGTANAGINATFPVTTTVSITNVNDPPTLANVATMANVAFNGQTITVSPALSVADPDNLTLVNATVRITGGTFAGDGDVLAATTTGTSIVASYNSTTETLTLAGIDTPAHYQQVLDSLTFDSTSSNPTNSASDPTRTLSWVANDGSASNNLSAAATTTIAFSPPPKNDFNGDAKSDVLLQNNDGLPQIWLMNGTSVTSMVTLLNPGPSWQVMATGDFNADGSTDILWQNTDGLTGIWEMNGLSVIAAGTLGNPGSSWHAIATGDFNSDGKADILWQNTDGMTGIWEMNGLSVIAAGSLGNPGSSWHAIGTGDFNGDGLADILWQNTDGTTGIWEMNGLSVIAAGTLGNPGSSWHAIATGDFNGDGLADILWQNTDGMTGIWEMNGLSVIAAGTLGNPGSSWHAIGTSDFNGDGKADIIWQNADGMPGIWEMNGTSVIGSGPLPNPGSTWHIKDDGPIGSDPTGAAAPPPTLHLSTPDAAAGPPSSGLSAAVVLGAAPADPIWKPQLIG